VEDSKDIYPPEPTEEDPKYNSYIPSIYNHKKEREWVETHIRTVQSHRTEENQKRLLSDEIESSIKVIRNPEPEQQDYASWPLEIKLLMPGNHNKMIILPAVLNQTNSKDEKNTRLLEDIQRKCYEIKKLMKHQVFFNINTYTLGIQCEISLAKT
jgi:hypothetical protein